MELKAYEIERNTGIRVPCMANVVSISVLKTLFTGTGFALDLNFI